MSQFSTVAPEQHPQSTLAAALECHARGWSIVPMAMTTKRPARKWKRYQRQPADVSQLSEWFGNGYGYGLGVVFGGVSGGLASRDFDDADAYQGWANDRSDLAATLPTVATNRGRHVYCTAAAGSVEAIRSELGKPNGTGAIKLGDGELRAGPGSYSVLPPSIHPSGHAYRWIVPLPPLGESLPILDLREAGFLNGELRTLSHAFPSPDSPTTEAHYTDTTTCDVFVSDSVIEAAIEASLPKQISERRDRIFDLARRLKAIPELADAPAADLLTHVHRWHARALPTIGTKAWDESWLDFLAAWAGVKYPAIREPLKAILARADAAEPPAVALAFQQPALRRLIALCRELQRVHGQKPFPLACRPPADLLGVDHDTVADWLKALCRAGILRRETIGDFIRHKAAEYRYVAPL